MKLFFDARYTRIDYHDGISRYSTELGIALAKLTPVTFLICEEGQKKWFPRNAKFMKIHPPTALKEPLTALVLNKYKPDVVYSPMQTIGTLGRRYKSVLTLHDMIYYRHPAAPASLPAHIRAGWWLYHQTYLPQRLILKGADLLTTVSATSAKEIIDAKMSSRAPVIVSNAPQKFNTQPVFNAKIKNIIYMGSFMPYKNVETLIRGMQWLPGRTLHLLSRISPEREQQLKALIPAKATIVFHRGVTDEEYEALLADNAILVTASLDEGYGIPVAEAMAMGVPVVVSDIPVFHEVGGEGALYFNPGIPKTFADAVQRLDHKAFRTKQIHKASEHIQTFNWDDSAKALFAAIKGLF
jgi:glycosyltransferase involved in cell wall biosynthesis